MLTHLWKEHKIPPWDERLQGLYPWHADTLVAMDRHDGKAYEDDTQPILDEIQAEYELPTLEGGIFDEQRQAIARMKADGTWNPSAEASEPPSFSEAEHLFDPLQGMGMPGREG